MFGESPDPDFDATKDEITSVPDIITDLVGEAAIPGIPAPVRRNFLKVMGQLSSAVIDVPVAFLEGIADERRAETAARVRLIYRSAEQIAQQMQTDPEYARLAAQKYGQRVIREQVNLDMISQRAAKELIDSSNAVDESDTEGTGDTIDDDWLNAFETEARLKSTEEMQAYFGRVLAGEIRKPGSYSARSVRILGSLDQSVASLFLRLCSVCISQFDDMRVSSLAGNAGNNALEEYGLNFGALNLLNEHGLVISDYNSWREFRTSLPVQATGKHTVFLPFGFQGKHWILMPKSNGKTGKNLRIHGVALTRSGMELSRIVEIEPVEEFSKALSQYLEKEGYRMVKVGHGGPQVVNLNADTGFDSK